ncbi:hypothetical protein GYMLUDRAFT_60152 [Collybiopsis luxurians FD-317 M1]|uniref:Methyltransferase n=1 Tax=Collybiopsis luxurians FD-317 M1 TaxID=944289 RepID=A0A0D0CAX2_9AGAR|nr:hypothetical protein GYMLUDRAFT_60152 [Collybiopsis luxurians FD-317 M1]
MPSATLDTVPGALFYFSPPTDGSEPYNRVNDDPSSTLPLSNWTPEKHTLQIENIRGREDAFTLDEAGFQYFKHPAKHTAFTDDEEIKAEYYPESEELIKELTGASKVVLFDHTIRRRVPGQVDMVGKRQPVKEVHVDQTHPSAIARVHLHCSPSEAPELLKHRFQIINLWRPISHPAFDMPLTLCDYRTVDAKNDLVAVARISSQRRGETYRVKHNPQHRWKYLKGMTPEEFVLIKWSVAPSDCHFNLSADLDLLISFDSTEDKNVSIFTPHTAFQDPTMPEGSPARESIELRALVFYD